MHDELILEVAPGEQERVEEILRTRMGGAAELTVPLDVSVGVGAELGGRGPLTGGPGPSTRRR